MHGITIIPDRLAQIEAVALESGGHSPDSHFCIMEAVAYVAGEPWSDQPACVSPVIGAFLRSWNDVLDDTDRQMLKPLIPQVIGTRTTAADEDARAWLAVDWSVRTLTPAFLRLAGLTDNADAVASLQRIDCSARLIAARDELERARSASDAASAAAWAAARDAAWDAARDAASAAASAAAWDAAWAAAWEIGRASCRERGE